MGLARTEPAKGDLEVWGRRLALGLAIALLVAVSLFFAVDRDGGLSLAMGMAIRDGRLPYRDLFENRTPALHYIVAALLTLWPSLWLVRAFLLGINLVGACLAQSLARHLGGRDAGRWAFLFYVVAILLFQGYTLVNEPFVAVLLLAGLWLAWVRRRPFPAALLATTVVWFKQPALLPAAALLAYLAWEARSWRERGLVVAGAALATLAPLAMLWAGGLLFPMLQQVIGSNLQTAGSIWNGWAELGKGLLELIATTGAFWALCAIGVGEGLALPALRRKMAGLAAVALAALLTFLPRPMLHYFLPAAALGSVAAGLGLATLLKGLAMPRQRLALLALALVPLLAQGAIPALSVLKQGYVFRQIALGRRLQSLTAPGEPILVLTHEPGYYYLAQRYPPVPTFFVLWVNDTPELQQQMLQSLGHSVHIALIVDQPDANRYAEKVAARIRSCGRLLAADPGLGTEIWQVEGCP